MACFAFILTLLVVPGTMAVRTAELALEDDSMHNDRAEEHSLEEERVSKNHVGVNPGFAGDRDCCCRAGPCSRADELGSLSAERQLPNATTPISCCSNISTSGSWTSLWMRCRGGDIVDVNVCNHEAPAASSIENCQAKMTWWFRRDDWYTLLPDSAAPGMAYESFVPCLHLKHIHVNDIVLSKLSYFNSGSAINPLRYYVVSRPECGALPNKDLMAALERSYDDLCPFPLPSDDYMPNLRPERACAFNKTTQAVHMSRSSRCPEGHKCACPVHGAQELTAGGETEKWRSSFSIFGYLTSFSTGSVFVHPLQSIVLSGTLAAASLTVASWLAVPYLAMAGTGLMVYGGRAGVQWVTHSCNARAGCYPLDCVYEEAVDGCRINLDTDESDIRNPYWFMPPPMYKCGVSRWGNCQMSACTAEDARQQTVGEGTATWGLRGRGSRSVLFNCQPMLAQDMSHSQAYNFENQVKEIRAKEHEVARRTTIMLDQLHRYCPYLQPADFMGAALCNDGTTCQMEQKDGPPCCLFNGGVRQCPAKFPKMCEDGTCDSEVTTCEEKGGLKECPAESRCPWIISRIEDNVVECQSGQIFNTSDFVSPTPWCGGEGGLKTCPWNAPYMCESKSCDGEHCCAADCTDLGGMRVCSGLAQVQPLQSAAPVTGPMSAQAFTFGLTLLSMLFMRPLH